MRFTFFPVLFLYVSLPPLLLILSFSTLLWNSASQRVPQSIRTKHYRTPFSGTSYTSAPTRTHTLTHTHTHRHTHTEGPLLLHTMCQTKWQKQSLHIGLGRSYLRWQTHPDTSTHDIHKPSIFNSKHIHTVSLVITHTPSEYIQKFLHVFIRHADSFFFFFLNASSCSQQTVLPCAYTHLHIHISLSLSLSHSPHTYLHQFTGSVHNSKHRTQWQTNSH